MVIDSQTAIPFQVLLFHNNSLGCLPFGEILRKATIATMIRTVSRAIMVILWDLFVLG
jgi:hypothetical protein